MIFRIQEGGQETDMKPTMEKLQEVAAVDIRSVIINTLTDLRDIVVDTKKPVPKNRAFFAEQTNNVYVHRMGDCIVKVRFQKEGSGIGDKMEEYLRRLAEIQFDCE